MNDHPDLPTPLKNMVYNGLQWFTMVYNGLQWFTMVYNGLQWLMVVNGWSMDG